MNWKDRAAGEREDQENPFTKEMCQRLGESAIKHGHDLEFLDGAMDYLLSKTGHKFSSVDERQIEIMRLATYPKWKILDGTEKFQGWYKDFYGFMDKLELKEPPLNTKALPYKSEDEKECGAKLWRGLQEIISNEEILDKKNAISELHKELINQYPKFKNFLTL